MQSEGNANHFVSIGINFGILLLCVFPTWVVLSKLDHSHETMVLKVDEDDEAVGAEQIPTKQISSK